MIVMKEFTNETPSELLTQLMDNELDPANETMVYEALGSSAELQEEHKLHLAVREAIKKDTEAFTPPAATVSSLFNKLGYAPPPPAATGGIIRRSPLMLSFFRKAAVPVMLLLAGSYGAFTLLNNTNDDFANTNRNIQIVQSSLAVNNTQSPENVNDLNNSENISSKKIVKSKTPVMSSVSSVNDNKVEIIANDEIVEVLPITTTSDANNFNNILTSSSAIDFQQNNFALNQSNQFVPNVLTPGRTNFASSLDGESNFIVVLKGINNFNSDLGGIFNNSENQFKNFSLGLLKSLGSNFSGGIELGQQSYSVMVSAPDNDTQILNEVRSVLWFGATARYDADYLELLNTHPFVQGSIAFGNFGRSLMPRMSCGIECKPFEANINLIAGYEWSMISNTINSKQFNSTADGMFVGFSFGF